MDILAKEQRGEVKVTLDKERVLKFTLNSLVYVEDMGVDIQKMGQNDSMKLKDLRTLLYAGLMHEDEELTAESVGAMIDVSELGTISEALNKAFSAVGK